MTKLTRLVAIPIRSGDAGLQRTRNGILLDCATMQARVLTGEAAP